jgi:hypothetical protein
MYRLTPDTHTHAGVVVLLRSDNKPRIIVFDEQHRRLAHVLSARYALTPSLDKDTALADAITRLVAAATTDAPDRDMVPLLAAAVVQKAAIHAGRPDATCMAIHADPTTTSTPDYQLEEGELDVFVAAQMRSGAGAVPLPTLPELLDMMIETVEGFWVTAEASDSWTTQLLASTPVGLVSFACPLDDRAQQAAVLAHQRFKLRCLGAQSYVLAAEVWVGAPDHPLAPSEQPDRREGMLVCAVSKEGECVSVTLELVRDESGRIMRLVRMPETGQSVKGALTTLLQ